MFCKVRSDELYRNSSDCLGILQCFGGDVCEYPPCSSGLVFSEAKSKCDYGDAVPECKSSSAVADEMKGCRGANHGELIPHESNCQYFYRCSRNHLEKMHCP
ncbi:unnamed protein product [Cylicocyclus nassatus]|uniref:Chitin-binding type-2 domain-containing protein n=1 Tax=Cylicocyclus nassatus TaxID=53992 RepID=A0AA36HH63_CYLNA|nr:unnamed protein product [Cylicocyclus nassatus]